MKMMNRFILYITLLLFAAKCLAQAPVLDSTWFPNAGDKYYLYRLDNSNPVTANDTGTNVTWDFSGIGLGFPSDSFDYFMPASRGVTCTNTSSTLSDGNFYTHSCYKKTSKGFYRTETNYVSDSQDIIYKKPILEIKNNFHFRQESKDTAIDYYYYHEPNHPKITDSPYRGKTIDYRKYDGYGTLKLPYGIQYDTAIRIHIIEYSADTIPDFTLQDNNNNRHDSLRFFSDFYEWYIPGIHNWVFKVFKINNTNWKGPGKYDTVNSHQYLYMAVSAGSGHADVQLLGSITADYNNNQLLMQGVFYNDLTYYVYDPQGKLISSGKPLMSGAGNARIPVDISQGMYLLKVQNGAGQARTFKIVKND
jgi:hypothetical protein